MQPTIHASLTRRAFLRRSAAASLLVMPWIIPASVRGGNGAVTPNERIQVGLIGCGAMGSGHLHVLAGHQQTQLVAVCDVDASRREPGARQADEISAAQRGTGSSRHCAAINDYRELLARPDIDAVLIATPDHWHSLQAIHAAQAGKDVYCEKPVSLTIREGRDMVNTMRRYARVFQTGTQYRSIPTIRQVCEFVRAGGLGRVKSVFTIWMKTNVPTLGPSYVPLDPALPAEPTPDYPGLLQLAGKVFLVVGAGQGIGGTRGRSKVWAWRKVPTSTAPKPSITQCGIAANRWDAPDEPQRREERGAEQAQPTVKEANR